MSSFTVVPAELELSALVLSGAAASAEAAHGAATGAQGAAAGFGGEPAQFQYADVCQYAAAVAEECFRALRSLSGCVRLAGEGYLVTDQGIIAAASIPGSVGSTDPTASTLVPINPVAPSGHLSPHPPGGMR